VIANFTGQSYAKYRIGVPIKGNYREIINSDKEIYGGTGVVNKKPLQSQEEPFHGMDYSVEMNLPPFGMVILRPVKERKERIENGKEEVRSNAAGRGKGKQA